jgi:molybdate transport system ATP-binding protein
MAEVERLAEQVVLLDKGHMVASAALSELQSDPSSPLAASRDAAVTLKGVVESSDSKFGLANVSITGGMLIAPAPPPTIGAIGELRCIRILASDVSLAHERPTSSSILNVLPARIVSMRKLDQYEALVVVSLGEKGDGAHPVPHDTKIFGGARTGRRPKRLCSGEICVDRPRSRRVGGIGDLVTI